MSRFNARSFLRKHHLWAKTAVVGVPAKWVVGKSITIPPTTRDTLKSILEIQAEQAFSLNYRDLVFDYSGQISSTHTNTLLLVAMQRQRLERITTLAERILTHIEGDPRQLRRARKFLNVYLDGVRQVTAGYARSHKQGGTGELEENFDAYRREPAPDEPGEGDE